MNIHKPLYFLTIILLFFIYINSTSANEDIQLPWDGYDAYFNNTDFNLKENTRQCLARNEQSMSKLFKLSVTRDLDGGASEAYSDILGKLLRWLGDEFFGNCLLKEPENIKQRVRGYILSENMTEYLYPLTLTGQSIFANYK